MVEVIRGDRKVEWVDLGEGLDGEYDPDNEDDVALLRFDVMELTKIDGLFRTVLNWSGNRSMMRLTVRRCQRTRPTTSCISQRNSS